MKNTRRGFLKTLGKLGAALGLTAAACSAHHHGHHGGQHPKHPKRSDIPVSKETLLSQIRTLKAHSRATPKAKMKAGFTGFKKIETTPLSYEALEETYQQAVQGQIKFAGNVTVRAGTRMPNTMLDVGKATEEAQKILDKLNPPNVETAVEMTSRHQEWLNRITMARIDNVSQSLNPKILLEDLWPDNS